MIMTNYIGNISTIVKEISMLIAGWFIGLLAAYGLNLGVDVSTLAKVIGAFIFLIIGYIDAKNPNTLKWLGNAPVPVASEETVLNDEYVTGDEDDTL